MTVLSATPLEGKLAVVTGGGVGIGGGVTRLFAEAGATVVVNDIDAEYATAAVADVQSAGGSAVAVVGDIRDKETVARLRDVALDVGDGRVDVLVNNVGDYRPNALFVESDEDQWDAQYAITLQHVFRVTHAFLPAMIGQGSGTIVNNSTVEAFRACPRNSVYTAFNAGVSAFTKTLAVEVGMHGIRVNAIAPDQVDSPQTPKDPMTDPELVQCWVPVGRFGEPVEYAKAMLFLASDLSSFVTGQTIMVDGGTMAASGFFKRYRAEGWTNRPAHP